MPTVPASPILEAATQPKPSQANLLMAAAEVSQMDRWQGEFSLRMHAPDVRKKIMEEQAGRSKKIEDAVRGPELRKFEEDMYKMSPRQLRELGVK